MSLHPSGIEQQVDLALIQPHPRNFDYVSPPSEVELHELADSMERIGQQTPIELVDVSEGRREAFVLVKGARRTEAAKVLRWTHLDAIVRTDTNDPNTPQVIEDLISDNLLRQQLDDLAIARCYRGLKELAKQNAAVGQTTRDYLAERLKCGKSGRTMERFESLLGLPRDIQDMISTRKLSKSDGYAIVDLDRATKQKVYAKLRAGVLPKHVLRQYGVIESINNYDPERIASKLLKRIGKDLIVLRKRMSEADVLFKDSEDFVDSLESYTDFFIEWNDHVATILD